ncbi:hypothetical protein BaRGS_00017175 [Batillaria attramentaria]|uniref:Uncharacterized protein n=1 Tax=Batillaria attramentaria TaxID=370345 RepID=A0ABD0KWV0_9CAEN
MCMNGMFANTKRAQEYLCPHLRLPRAVPQPDLRQSSPMFRVNPPLPAFPSALLPAWDSLSRLANDHKYHASHKARPPSNSQSILEELSPRKCCHFYSASSAVHFTFHLR